MAGAFDREVTPTDQLWQQAHSTYVSNLRVAADECSKVCIFSSGENFKQLNADVFIAVQRGITVLIEAISVIPNYFLRHQQQGHKHHSVVYVYVCGCVDYLSPTLQG